MMGQPSFGATFCDLSASAVVMDYIATLAALATACAIDAFQFSYPAAIFAFVFVWFMLLIF